MRLLLELGAPQEIINIVIIILLIIFSIIMFIRYRNIDNKENAIKLPKKINYLGLIILIPVLLSTIVLHWNTSNLLFEIIIIIAALILWLVVNSIKSNNK